MEFLSKYQIKSITSKWNIARNSNSSVPLRLEIEKRIQKKKIKNFQNEIIKFLFDEKFNFKEVETYLELRDIYSQILFRSRLVYRLTHFDPLLYFLCGTANYEEITLIHIR